MTLDRRQLLRYAALGAVAWQLTPWLDRWAGADPPNPPPVPDPVGLLGTTSDPETMTLEAFADTLIPGAKRAADDYAIAGAAAGAGAVQAGAVAFMRFEPVGVAPLLPAVATSIDAAAATFAVEHHIVLDPTLPPFVALSFTDRTRLLRHTLEGSAGTQQTYWFALAGLVFLAYHTAGHLHTAEAVRAGHPGLRAIGFPLPDRDGLWRFPRFSYRRRLAAEHPATTRSGSPP